LRNIERNFKQRKSRRAVALPDQEGHDRHHRAQRDQQQQRDELVDSQKQSVLQASLIAGREAGRAGICHKSRSVHASSPCLEAWVEVMLQRNIHFILCDWRWRGFHHFAEQMNTFGDNSG
jgi:hypothetical protein